MSTNGDRIDIAMASLKAAGTLVVDGQAGLFIDDIRGDQLVTRSYRTSRFPDGTVKDVVGLDIIPVNILAKASAKHELRVARGGFP